MLFTTRCAGTFSLAFPAPFIAQPTILADRFVPRQRAMAPYDVTLPLGICLAIWYTSSKKLSSLPPDGLTDFNLPVSTERFRGADLLIAFFF
jgi:hypothetical protein